MGQNPFVSFRFLTPDDGNDGFPETSVISYNYSLCNNPEELSCQISVEFIAVIYSREQ
jgi:hypothetical protein